ncbi:hypothetical protein [Roseobacter sp.]|uniref:hypothetical protein n=1 Tax=Roseobacter sp. TaxID=1907202 RepID=UPI0032970D2F
MIAGHSLLAARKSAAASYIVPCLAVTVALFGGLSLLEDVLQRSLLQEGGVIETISALLYVVAIAVLLPAFRAVWPFVTLLAVFSMREFDLDKQLFTEGLFKSRQFVGDTVPISERVVSLAILLVIVVSIVFVLARGLRGLPRRLREGDGVLLCVLLGSALAFTSKLADGFGRKLAEFGIIITEGVDLAALTYEEIGELGMALSFLIAAYAFIRLFNAEHVGHHTAEIME